MPRPRKKPVEESDEIKAEAEKMRKEFGVDKAAVVKVRREIPIEEAAKKRRLRQDAARIGRKLKVDSSALKCPDCGAVYKSDKSLWTHISRKPRTCERFLRRSTFPGFKCAECDFATLKRHRLWVHKKKMPVSCAKFTKKRQTEEEITFTSEAKFVDWKSGMEKEAGVRFVRSNGDKKMANGRTYKIYQCSMCDTVKKRRVDRSKRGRTTTDGAKADADEASTSKSEDPPSISKCPAFIRAVFAPNETSASINVTVRFCSQHADHGRELESETTHFVSFVQFNDWKMRLERSTGVRFIKRNSNHTMKSGRIWSKYECNGTARKRQLIDVHGQRYWTKSTRPSDVQCPAFITAKIDPNDEVWVRYCTVHVGHQPNKVELATEQTDQSAICQEPMSLCEAEKTYEEQSISQNFADQPSFAEYNSDPASVSLYEAPQRNTAPRRKPTAINNNSIRRPRPKPRRHTHAADSGRSRLEKLEEIIAAARSKDGHGAEHLWRAIDSAIDNTHEMIKSIRLPARPKVVERERQGPRILLPYAGVSAVTEAAVARRAQPQVEDYAQQIQVDSNEWIEVVTTATDWTGGNLVNPANYVTSSGQTYYYIQ